MKTLNEVILNTKRQLRNSFFKVIQDGDKFIIKEYFGPKKSLYKMHIDGWNRFDSIISEINESYPIFNIKDFKAIDKNTIVKKTEHDYLEEELVRYIKYFELSDDLFNAVKSLKEILIALNINYMSYGNFTDVQNIVTTTLNNNRLDGSKYLSLFSNNVNSVYLELEKLKIRNPRNLFNEKFNFFFALIK